MFENLFGRKRKGDEGGSSKGNDKSFGFLSHDMHAHILPGIDDGAQTVEDSLALVKELQLLGYKGIVATPHIKSDFFPNTKETIGQALNMLRSELSARSINFPVHAAAEYFLDEHFLELLERRDLLTIRDNEVLVEFSFMFEPMGLTDTFFRMQTMGYKPVLAHPERYVYLHQKPEVFRGFKDRGCLLQLNTIALSGYYGKGVKELAEHLLSEGLYDYCGSDIHHLRHADALRKVLDSKVYTTLLKYPFLNSRLSE